HLPDDNTLVARRITDMQTGLYANPRYLKEYGAPATPEELLNHHGLILVTGGGEQLHWKLSRGNDKWEGLPLKILTANSLGLQRDFAIKGMGIVGLSHRFARAAVEDGTLQRVLPDWSLPTTVVWCVTAGRRLLPQRTLAFI